MIIKLVEEAYIGLGLYMWIPHSGLMVGTTSKGISNNVEDHYNSSTTHGTECCLIIHWRNRYTISFQKWFESNYTDIKIINVRHYEFKSHMNNQVSGLPQHIG